MLQKAIYTLLPDHYMTFSFITFEVGITAKVAPREDARGRRAGGDGEEDAAKGRKQKAGSRKQEAGSGRQKAERNMKRTTSAGTDGRVGSHLMQRAPHPQQKPAKLVAVAEASPILAMCHATARTTHYHRLASCVLRLALAASELEPRL